ncbi:MAG TPA: DUF397 domain-containing protein [Streptosporangiaceae bacterium]|nr:DUF397 domain-containing protein [Streptosporangiaceae bacterium]
MKRIWLPSDAWRKSSYSADSGQCVEIGQNTLRQIFVRDSKTVSDQLLSIHYDGWGKFTDRVKRL